MMVKELREKSVDELHTIGGEKRRELFDLRFKHFTGQLVDTAALGVARRTIARIETVIREREIAQAGE
jgi:large subunit ribosomal protein L29